MKKLITLTCLIFSCLIVFGQTKPFCSTDGNVSDHLSKIKSVKRISSANRLSTIQSCVYINVYFHFLRKSDGTGGQNSPIINTVMANLASAYSTFNVYFISKGYDEIKNDSYYNMYNDDASLYNSLVVTNTVLNSINIYLLDDYSHFSGGKAATIPSTALVVGGNNGVQVYSSTLVVAHEMGHCLGLYHTFEEYFGKELVNESNCTNAGDLICDTPAQPKELTFAVDANCQAIKTAIDANGQIYQPDYSNIMNYVLPSCMNHFTNGQGVRFNEIIANSPVLAPVISTPIISGPSTICTNAGQYSIPGLSGLTVTWSSSNTSGLTIDVNGLATRVGNFNGSIIITATINGGCGNNTLTIPVTVGSGVSSIGLTATSRSCTADKQDGITVYQATSVPNATNYKWYVNNILDPSNSTNIASIGYDANTHYSLYCIVTNPCGQFQSSTVTGYVSCSSSCQGRGCDRAASIFPNPADDKFTVAMIGQASLLPSSSENVNTEELSFGDIIQTAKFRVDIYNRFNQKINSSLSDNGKVLFNTKDLLNGFYYLQIQDGENVERRQILIQH